MLYPTTTQANFSSHISQRHAILLGSDQRPEAFLLRILETSCSEFQATVVGKTLTFFGPPNFALHLGESRTSSLTVHDENSPENWLERRYFRFHCYFLPSRANVFPTS